MESKNNVGADYLEGNSSLNEEQSDFQVYITSNSDNCIDLLEAACGGDTSNQKSLVSKERDRLLKITADTVRALLNNQNLEQGIAQALQIIGEGIDTDRVAVMKHHHDSLGASSGYLKMLYEWHSAHAISQLNHPDFQQVSYEGMENWYEQLNQGNIIGRLVDGLSEPVSSQQKEIGVKSTYAVPIAINNRYWGIIAFDDCRESKQRSETEISMLKTTAVCVGSAIEKNRVREQQEQNERNILLERQKATQIAKHNQVLAKREGEIQRSYRLLAASASAVNVISTEENFERGIKQALKIIGESINTDRVSVMEHCHDRSGQSSGYVRALYEWDSIYAISQLNHPEVSRISWNGIEDWYELMSQGKWAGGVVNELPEPFRSKMEVIKVKSTYAIPILVEGNYWGIVGIDNCRKPSRFNEAEINILKTAAACIGGAIEKERNRQARAKAEQKILLEREKAALEKATHLLESNQTLSLRDKWLEATANAANKLLAIADLDDAINAALKVLGESLNCDRVNIMQHFGNSLDKSLEFVRMIYEWDSPHAVSQMSHPELNEVSAQGIENLFATLKAGDWIGGTIDEFKEPFRSGQVELGVKATYSVPIFVNNLYWGVICIDFCRQPRCLTTPEIAVFKTAASCIGSAIYRQQIQHDKEQAELAILDERNRMAQEIHDTLAQAFTGISLQLEAARNILATQPEIAQERLLQAKKLAKEGINEARRSVRALRPEVLESKDLEVALHQLVDDMTFGTDTKAQVIIEDKLQLTFNLEVDLFRIAQEAITNTLRHARATELVICLTCRSDFVELQIKDNGIGFESQQLLNNSFGLIGMQARCDRHNGRLTINSSRDLGTEITVTVPITGA